MNYSALKKFDIANGVGVRVTIFVSGCTHHCKNCFNKETWDFNSGERYTEETEKEILDALAPDHITGLTLLGGEPMEPSNQEGLLPLLKKVKEGYPQKDIWCYTGYTYEKDLLSESRARCEYTDEMLSLIDVLVDGEFKEDEYSIMLKFKGSANQRLIDMNETRRQGKTVLLEI